MKLSLRNLALTAALCMSGAMMAQGLTVTKTWSMVMTADQATHADSRFGTGFGGKIYFNDKGKGKVMVCDGTTVKEFATVDGVGTGITTDEAGNVIVNTDFPNAASSTNLVLIKADGSEQKAVTLDVPTGFVPGRCDQLGRVAGDVFSEEGGILYIAAANNTTVLMAYFQNGAQAEGEFSFFTSNTTAALNQNTIAQPMYGIAELIEMGDDAVNACAWRYRSSIDPMIWDGSDWVAFGTRPEGAGSNEGFDIFNLGGVDYVVLPYKGGGNAYTEHFLIADTEGNVIFTSETENGNAGYTGGNSLTARKVDDSTVELYVFNPKTGATLAAMYTIKAESQKPDVALYAAGNVLGNGWNPENAIELTYRDGKYYLEIGETGPCDFKLSKVKGPWDAPVEAPETPSFNSGVIGIADAATDISLGTVYTLAEGAKGNINIPAAGTYTVVVDLANMTLELTGEKAPATAPESAEVYVRGDNSSWNADEAWKFTDCGTKDAARIYTLFLTDGKVLNGQFKIADADWGTVNFGVADGSTNQVMVGPTIQLMFGGYDNNLEAKNLTNVTLVFTHSGDSDVPSTLQVKPGEYKPEVGGVEDLQVADDADAVYYNLQGVEVDAENLPAGVYVKVAGGKATKVLVK